MVFPFITAFYSDPHYGHGRIIELCKRPFTDVDHMTRELISRYNSKITPDDIVLFCGDAFFCNVEKAKAIMSQLNGRKILVKGNHDRGDGSMAGIGFDLVMDEAVMEIAGRTIRIKHYPYAANVMSNNEIENRYLDRRPKKLKGEILIHGHTHSTKKINKMNGIQIHVGCDAWDYFPVLMSEIEELIQKL